MSSIGSDPHLNVSGLGGLGGQVALDDLQGRQQPGPQPADALRETAPPHPGVPAPEADAGERVLRADAWSGAAGGSRLLPGDPGFESALGRLDLSAAADRAVDAILAGLDTGA